uniref:Uncharacterized protein n=1 Tax=Anguilla anguilla TaxID=7936 RepID=A0A0E9RE15_ANGAN
MVEFSSFIPPVKQTTYYREKIDIFLKMQRTVNYIYN